MISKKLVMKILHPFILAMFLFFFMNNVKSQVDTAQHASQKDLAKAAANPIANMISLPFQLNFNLGVGEYNRTQTTLNIMPVIPFGVGSWNVINRIIIPVVQKPDGTESGSYYGLGNTNYSMLFVPPMKAGGTFQWGFGPAFGIPTSSSDQLGTNVFGIGPALIFLVMPGHWVVGVTFNQLWAYRESVDYSSFFAQYFITYNIKKGWYVNTNPMLTANFNAAEGEQWNIPLGAGFGRVFHAGSQPMKLQLQAYYNVVKPTGGANGSIQIQYVLLFPH
jgi:hypothetical protein